MSAWSEMRGGGIHFFRNLVIHQSIFSHCEDWLQPFHNVAGAHFFKLLLPISLAINEVSCLPTDLSSCNHLSINDQNNH